MAATDRSRSDAAKQRRQDQLQRWSGSETDRTGPDTRETSVGSGARRARVRFAQGAVFMAACSAGDQEEVAALLRQGADINHANIDGLTALHQACIDENSEMVQFLVESGSDINRGDNEGWTPLHAAASCGFIQITKYLIEHGAHVGSVNSEGELPLDVATEDVMVRLLKGEIKKQGVDVDQARKQEQRVMLQDATAVLKGSGSLVPHHNTKATALHVAAAKGYIEVLKVLLQCEIDVDSMDIDGWTPLHAAAHWGQEEVCSLLADHMCDMAAVNNVGQTPLDVSDENLVGTLEELQKKQNALRSEREKQTPVIDTNSPISVAPVRPRRTSISRMSSKEKICLHEREKHPPPALRSTPSQAKASSSSSSEEESESESDAESEKAKNREIINNLNNKHNSGGLLASSTSATGNTAKKQEPSKSQSTEAPGSWRTSLRKAGSSVTLASAGGTEPSQDPPRPLDSGPGMSRSASSPRLSSEADAKEPSWLSRSSSYTRRHHSQSGSDLTGSDLTSTNPALPRRNSQEATEKKDQEAEAEAQRKARSRHARQSRRSTQGVTLTDLQEEVSWRSRIASLQNPPGPLHDLSYLTGMRWMRARGRARRIAGPGRAGRGDERGPGGGPSGPERVTTTSPVGKRSSQATGRHLNPRSNVSCNDCSQGAGSETKDYKKLFDEVSRENSHLQFQLQDTQRIMSQTRVDLEKATQRQERISDCSNLLDETSECYDGHGPALPQKRHETMAKYYGL
ncbi:hypothetical protein NHX12_002946 [Muraenolepis orangiensis]|uniref:Protein phosphatase 1 regulatory subunit n=1 Tax=Muraenolepis orangiensis TaxID=630683 RepID=A0A9Q0DXU2_9TELE|nr:hypothetical protein NHX12_002946 [Muraenolepis orangiensis]